MMAPVTTATSPPRVSTQSVSPPPLSMLSSVTKNTNGNDNDNETTALTVNENATERSNESQNESIAVENGMSRIKQHTDHATNQPDNTAATEIDNIPNKNNTMVDSPAEEEIRAHHPTDPLPADLREILMVVARSGQCPWLPWNNPNHCLQQDFPISPAERDSGSSNPKRSSPATSTITSPLQHTVPPRKKRKNALRSSMKDISRRRYAESVAGHKSPTGSNNTSRKRPLFLIRTTASSNTSTAFSTGSVGSGGRTSGSEHDDSTTQYECDSEGTSATTNSELSMGERREQLRKKVHGVSKTLSVPRYRTLREAIRTALGLVLDHSYRHGDGYKLSPAELRRNALAAATGEDEQQQLQIHLKMSPERVFQDRLKRLLALLEDDDGGNTMVVDNDIPPFLTAKDTESNTVETNITQKTDGSSTFSEGIVGDDTDIDGTVKYPTTTTSAYADTLGVNDGPPFTIQRVAEVLLSPDRYYTQTHKLCNCLEKLLLVTTLSTEFGGHTGGDCSQNRTEIQELAALANEKERERSLRHRMSSVSSADDIEVSDGVGGCKESAVFSTEFAKSSENGVSPVWSKGDMDETERSHAHAREILEAAARASLQNKFQHIANDLHTASADAEEECASFPPPPPPGFAMPASPPSIALQTPLGTGGFARQHTPEQQPGGVGGVMGADSYSDAHHHLLASSPSPVLFTGTDSAMHSLQMHHATALFGATPVSGNPLDIVIDPTSGTSVATPAADDGDPEMDPGRSSASNSDVDSDLDDVSLDDSTSDRSDGSDTGSLKYEPFTAARVMALNRMQQQQRSQSRAFPSTGSHLGDGFRLSADYEYQSGDSVDSMVAEDSGGSDSSVSSSSDVAD